MRAEVSKAIEWVLRDQDGVCHGFQLLTAGMTRHGIAAQVHARRWQRVYDNVYAATNGPLSWHQRVGAAVLAAGTGACASSQTAAALYGFGPMSVPVHVTIPARRRVRGGPGMRVHRSSRLDGTQVQWARWPPRTRPERTALDLVDAAESVEEAFGWLAAACQRRLTTPERLLNSAQASPELRWRAAVTVALGDIALGVHSQLERLHRRIEERHGLPLSQRQTADRPGGGAHRWLDCDYAPLRVRAELDGRLGHDQLRETWRDYRRDNDGVLSGRAVLRYGWADITSRPCAVAAQTGEVLRQAGWTGRVRPCGTRCAANSVRQWSA